MLYEAMEKTERMHMPCLHNENVPFLQKEKRCLIFKWVDDMSRLFTKKKKEGGVMEKLKKERDGKRVGITILTGKKQ